MSVECDSVQLLTKYVKEKDKMNLSEKYKVGETYTTTKSGITGTIEQVAANATGSVRILVITSEGVKHWTTATKQAIGARVSLARANKPSTYPQVGDNLSTATAGPSDPKIAQLRRA